MLYLNTRFGCDGVAARWTIVTQTPCPACPIAESRERAFVPVPRPQLAQLCARDGSDVDYHRRL